MSNRKIEACPRCGRPETVAEERELVLCGVCALNRGEGLNKKNLSVNGEDLKALRVDKGLPLKELARELRLTPAYISMMESGKKPLNHRACQWFQDNKS